MWQQELSLMTKAFNGRAVTKGQGTESGVIEQKLVLEEINI